MKAGVKEAQEDKILWIRNIAIEKKLMLILAVNKVFHFVQLLLEVIVVNTEVQIGWLNQGVTALAIVHSSLVKPGGHKTT